MMKRSAAILTFCLAFACGSHPAIAQTDAWGFDTEQQASLHCAGGGIVWMDTMAHNFYFKGSTRYGKTKGGQYVCQREAERAGFRPAANPSAALPGFR